MKIRRVKKVIDRDVFGGRTLRNSRFGGTHAKRKRPLQNGEWLHVCLKSGVARGTRSMLRPHLKQNIERIVERSTRHTEIRISKWQNVGNHIHFSVFIPSRNAYNRWIRSIAGLIARAALETERGLGCKSIAETHGKKDVARERRDSSNQKTWTPGKETFWESRPFTRIVRGWEAFDRLSRYITKNKLEALGFTNARAKEIVRMIELKELYLEQTAAIDISRPPPP